MQFESGGGPTPKETPLRDKEDKNEEVVPVDPPEIEKKEENPESEVPKAAEDELAAFSVQVIKAD